MIPMIEFESVLVSRTVDPEPMLLIAFFDRVELPAGERACVALSMCSAVTGEALRLALGSALDVAAPQG